MNTYHKELLLSALDAREREVTEYQVNIDNFSLAVERIGDDAELQDFKSNLQNLLTSARLEQRKAKLMLDVIKSQLEGVQ